MHLIPSHTDNFSSIPSDYKCIQQINEPVNVYFSNTKLCADIKYMHHVQNILFENIYHISNIMKFALIIVDEI